MNELNYFSEPIEPLTVEDMSLPCPEDICDGSGTVVDEEGVDRTCPHVLEDDRYDPDRDY